MVSSLVRESAPTALERIGICCRVSQGQNHMVSGKLMELAEIFEKNEEA